MAPTNRVLTAEHLTRFFGRGDTRTTAFRDLDVAVPRGEWTTVLGPAGSGKTALFECLTGLALPSEGSVFIHDGKHSRRRALELSSLSDNARTRLRRSRIGALPSECDLMPSLTLRENLLLGTRLARHRVDRAAFREQCADYGLGAHLRKSPDSVPADVRLRARLLRTLLTEPDVLLLDEPTAALEAGQTADLLQLLRELVTAHHTVVVCTSDDRMAEQGDHVLMLPGGLPAGVDRPHPGSPGDSRVPRMPALKGVPPVTAPPRPAQTEPDPVAAELLPVPASRLQVTTPGEEPSRC